MGDLRDQLKKIKNALGMGGAEKKSVSPIRAVERNAIEVTTKKNYSESVPPLVAKPLPETIKTQPIKPTQQIVQNNAQVLSKKTQDSPHSTQTTDRLYVSPSGVTITRALTPSVRLKAVPTPNVKATSSSLPMQSTAHAGQLVLPSFTALARKSEFRIPDPWVARGTLSQLGGQLSGHRRDIFIGLDFGTAFTKAAVQILDNIYPIDWGGIANLKDKHLLPTEYSEASNGQCYLGQHPDASPKEFHANLKQSFITQSVSDLTLAKSIVFCALVIQYIRAWVYKNHESKLGLSSFGWYLNIGVPSDVLDQDAHAQKYRILANNAWTLSLRPQSEINLANAFQSLSEQSRVHHDLYDCSPIPELVAQLSGYSKSSRRQNGLHVLVDIGGGTVDMVTFNVHQVNGDDNFPFFVSSVKPFGSYALLANRFLNLSTQRAQLPSDLQNLLSPEDFSKFFNSSLASVQSMDKKFFRNFQLEFESVLAITHRKRYQSSPYWQSGIRTFISGGGSFVPGYLESIRCSRRPLNCELHEMELPPHPKLVGSGIDLHQYSRISVACGLAEDRFSMGKIVPASAVPDGTALITTVNGLSPRERPDRDELYPK